jgi:hypothetical protein
MATWPEKFKILRDNFQDSLGDRTIRSSMDIGPAKIRRRTILTVSNVSFSMMLNQEDYEEFKEFYYNNDVGVFDFQRPDSNKIVQARFGSAPSASMNETLWLVNVNLEILP